VGKKLVLAVIDGLPPQMLEDGIADERLPTLRLLSEQGVYTRGVSTFPSVTPVCLSAIATGGGPDVHWIPHLVWYHREEQRIVEYGSSFAAARATGLRDAMRDSIVNMSQSHLSPHARTLFERLEEQGLVTAAVNFTCYRAGTRHRIRLPGVASRNRWYESIYGPQRFFFFNLYESDVTGAPLAVRSRGAGSVDAYADAVGRWLVTRDGFDFLLYYLPDYDYAAHLAGPENARPALERADASLGRLVEAAGGIDEFLERYALIVCSDHGQTHVRSVGRLESAFSDLDLLVPRRPRPDRCDIAVTSSNRAAMIYRLPGCRLEARALAERLDTEPAADLVLFLEGGDAVARREGSELRFAPVRDGWSVSGDPTVIDSSRYPRGMERAWHALACPRAGDVIVSAAEGYEFADLGGRHHSGGGSHGSLLAGDSEVPMLAVGLDLPSSASGAPSITDLTPAVVAHFQLGRVARSVESAAAGA
jgi:hypothetical protein